MKQSESHVRLSQGLIIALCVSQPVMDVLSFWLITLGKSTEVTLTIRFLMLAGTVCAAWVMTDRRGLLAGTVAVGAAFYCLHFWAGWRAGSFISPAALVSDLTNYIRVFQIPLMTFALAIFLKRAENGRRSMYLGLTVSFFLIAAVELLSTLTGTDPHTYANKGIGILGWFYLPSAQGAILSMLFPPVLCLAMEQKQLWKTVLIAAVGFAELYLFATRLTYMAIFLTGFGLAAVFLLWDRKQKKQAAVVVLCVLVCGAGFFVSPMKRNQDRLAINAGVREKLYEKLLQQGVDEFGTEGSDYLTYVYEDRLDGLVDRFGLDTVAEYFDYTTDAKVLANVRLVKRSYCELLMRRSPKTSRWFGLSYPEMIWNGHAFDVENDLYGILYLYGYVGLGLMVLYLGWFAWRLFRALFRDFRRYACPETAAVCIMLACGFLHALFTAGLLRRPNASFYLSAALALLWWYTRQDSETEMRRV
ncbi:MAG: O-antigen ligase family protein [Oscillospiraceae bacterium]|nr:O-antigen ligase family protein [Oscillospiraceae bacterium]